VTGKSAATGKPHYFGERYPEDGPNCIWCGNPFQHEWHIQSPPQVMTFRTPGYSLVTYGDPIRR
jgi:hypothetical protein